MTDRGDSPGPPWAPDPWPGLPWPEPWDPTRPDTPAAPGAAGDAGRATGETAGPPHAAAPGAWSTALPPAAAGTPRPGGTTSGPAGTTTGAEGAIAGRPGGGPSTSIARPGESTEPWDPVRPDAPEHPAAAGVPEGATGPDPATGRRRHRWAALAGFAAVAGAAAGGGALVGPARPATMRWYRSLAKPPFQPPASAFGPVWSVLYGAIALSGWRVWRRPGTPDRSRALRLWAAQMAANAAWTPLFFGARRPGMALADLAAQLSSTAGYTAAAARVDRPAAALMAPYLAWTAFAGVLNEEIVRRNR